MFRLYRISSVKGLLAPLFITSPKQFSRSIPPLRSLVLRHIHSSRLRKKDPASSPAVNVIDGYKHLLKGDLFSGEKHETVPGRDNNSYEKKVLPPELSKNVVTLACDSSADGGVCDVFVVGTIHSSKESAKKVQAVIDFLKPQVVFLELCAKSIPDLAPQDLKADTRPCEFRAAYEEAMKYGGKVILGDIPNHITLWRTWAKMPPSHMMKLVFPNPGCKVFIKRLEEVDAEEKFTVLVEAVSKEFPTVLETLVHERDQYMSALLLKIAKQHNSVVAVVGKAHLQGIKKIWKQPVDVDMEEILRMPSRIRSITVGKILASIVVVSYFYRLYLTIGVIGVYIIYGIYLCIN